MPHKIEQMGLKHLFKRIQELGKAIQSRNGTFDLSVDDKDAELTAKGKPFKKIDFITFTKKQHNAIVNERPFDIYIVCGVSGDEQEIYRVSSEKLRSVTPKEIVSYEYSRTLIQNLVEKI